MIKAFLFVYAATIVSTFGQGVIRFETDLRPAVDAPVFLPRSFTGPGPDFSAQLFMLSTTGALIPLSPATTFRAAGTVSDSIADRYVNPVDVIVPDHPTGSSVTLIMRVWGTSLGSYDNAVRSASCEFGQSTPFTITLGGGENPPAPLSGLFSFILGHLGCYGPDRPSISGIKIQNGQAVVTADITNESARLQGTSDLQTWTNLQSTIAVVFGGTRTFTLEVAETYRYYRIVEGALK